MCFMTLFGGGIENKPAPDKVTIQFHLHELEGRKPKLVSIDPDLFGPDKYSLTQAGRKYVIDHKLNKPEEDSN